MSTSVKIFLYPLFFANACTFLGFDLPKDGLFASIMSFRYQPCKKKSKSTPLALAARARGNKKQRHPHARCSCHTQRAEQTSSERKKYRTSKRRQENHHPFLIARYRSKSMAKKNVDAVGIEPTTFHKYAEECEAKIIPLDFGMLVGL
ncbi:hypothetical protein BKA58DRAFT_378512 [Alternaria rosae]|uniref:uncharacterized protein n=1 Tax=Alternaria rosae TaxID=1187941 RepID=UPI001E8E5419|nr:uncharacterized protein BKA58DRAFT_378512 [Alternaria rosae]KAH6879038.1 hypothetical protein BKA58DRAFT_378512 [Alternaria rosae]